LSSLAVPTVVAAVIVFLVSFVIHMVLTYHRSDYKKIPNEDEALEALRRLNIPPGDYLAPHAGSPEAMRNPEFVARMTKGPLLVMTLSAGGPPAMGKNLVQWFLYTLVVGFFSGYLASRVLGPGTHYLTVFRVVGTSAFMGYSLGLVQDSIWHRRDWVTTAKMAFDGLVFALMTAGTFGWLWPR
jgi:uncharacterized membrane protein (DUF485 family)